MSRLLRIECLININNLRPWSIDVSLEMKIEKEKVGGPEVSKELPQPPMCRAALEILLYLLRTNAE